MLRHLLLAAAVSVAATACSADKTTSPNFGSAVIPTAPVRTPHFGILRHVMLEAGGDEWTLEVGDGTSLVLVGGPMETYPTLEGKAVVIYGTIDDNGALAVESCEQDTRILVTTRRK